MSAGDDPDDPGEPADGLVAGELASEFPGLRLRWTVVDGVPGRTPPELRERLADVTRRFRGVTAVTLRSRPVPQAYRVFFRHIGLDPDTDRTPVEQAAVARLITGDFCSGDRLADALALAVIETGVALTAFDDALLEGELTLRPARAGETLPAGEYAHDVPPGRLVLADDRGPVSVLFGRTSDRHAPGRRTVRLRLVAIVAPGVPEVHVDEALWLAAGALSG
jgi:DNA/RNA-binding domain of Phe-tRNA-synthetase-like protein